MTRRDAYPPGTPCWVDLGSPDIDASRSFYSDLLGWVAQPGDAEHGGYTVFTLDGLEVAGVGPIGGTGFAPSWGVYLSVLDADATAATVTAAGGGVVVAPFDIGDAGRMAVFTDSTDAAVHVWQPRTFAGARVTHEPGSLTWAELSTRDPEGARAFYSSVFGWQCRSVPMGFGPYSVFSVDGADVGGMAQMAPGMPAEPAAFWTPYFEVLDPDETSGRCADLGGRVLLGATDIAAGRFALVADQFGATFGVIRAAT